MFKTRRGRMAVQVDMDEAKYNTNYESTLTLPEPTWYRPGSNEKIEVLKQRFANRQHLFHPMDAGGPLNQEDLIPGIRREFVRGVWRCLVDTQVKGVRIRKHFGRDYAGAVRYLNEVKRAMGVQTNEEL